MNKLKQLSDATKENKSNDEDLLAILDLLDEKDIAELVSILLKKPTGNI